MKLAWIVLAGCAGAPPASSPDAPPGDTPVVPPAVRIDGDTREWFHATGLPATVGGVAIELDGAVPRPRTASDTVGAFGLDVPPGSIGFPIASHEGFRLTRNPEVLVLEDPVIRDLRLVAEVDVRSMYLAAVGTPPTPNTAVVFADLRSHGEPDLVALSEVALVTEDGASIGARGPFVVNAIGQLDLAATTSSATFDGRAVVTWLDCRPGAWRIAIRGEQLPQRVICDAGGATLVDTTRADDPVLPPRPTFTDDVFPRLQRPSLDPRGLACTTCHHTGAVAAGAVPISYDGSPSAVYVAITTRALQQPAGARIVDLEAPAQSLLLHRPLFEPPPGVQDHPNATLVDERSFDYLVIRRWIEQGAVE